MCSVCRYAIAALMSRSANRSTPSGATCTVSFDAKGNQPANAVHGEQFNICLPGRWVLDMLLWAGELPSTLATTADQADSIQLMNRSHEYSQMSVAKYAELQSHHEILRCWRCGHAQLQHRRLSLGQMWHLASHRTSQCNAARSDFDQVTCRIQLRRALGPVWLVKRSAQSSLVRQRGVAQVAHHAHIYFQSIYAFVS